MKNLSVFFVFVLSLFPSLCRAQGLALTVQPTNQSVITGSTAYFFADLNTNGFCEGDFTYQWQHIVNCLFFVLAIAFCFQMKSQTNSQLYQSLSTNTFSLSQRDIRDWVGDEEEHFVGGLQDHLALPETLPSDQDINGNWGLMTNGLQLSLRFTRHGQFFVGSIVPAMAVFRNLEPYTRTLLLTNSSSLFITYLVRLGTNGYLPERKQGSQSATDVSIEPSPLRGFFSWIFNARSEKIVVVDLNQLFDLSQPGEYSVQAICRVYSPTTKAPIFEVSSGIVTFQILKKPPSP